MPEPSAKVSNTQEVLKRKRSARIRIVGCSATLKTAGMAARREA